MADKSFGVKELNLLNASGTPTVTSPNNLNLNANTVAISTSCTIGSNLTVTGATSVANVNSSGIATATTFVGNLTGNVTGNTSGSSGSCSGNSATATEATNVTVTANNSTNETVYPVFVDGATGTQGCLLYTSDAADD